MDEGSFALNEILQPVMSTWERYHRSPSELSESTMSDLIFDRRDCRVELRKTGNGVVETEDEGPGWRGVW